MPTTPTPAPPRPTEATGEPSGWGGAAVVGLGVLAAALVTAWLTAELVGVRGPVTAVGDVVVDRAPDAVRSWAIDTLGTADKPALGLGTVVLLGLVAVVVARWAQRRRWAILVGPAVLGLVGAAAASAGPDGAEGILPAVVGAAAAAGALWWLVPAPTRSPLPTEAERRRFLLRAASLGAATAVIGAGGAVAAADRRRRFDDAARAIALPPPAERAAAGPEVAAASVGEGVEPWLTPASDFYRIDTALVPPRIDLDSWRLRIGGMVDRPVELTFADLLERELVERHVTLTCVSNEVGGDLVGNARWLGVRLADLLADAGPDPRAVQLASRSADGWTCGFPTEAALDGRDALVAIGMNGEPLPVRHGFPARLVVPGLYGYVSATKWLTEIELTTWEDFEGYWLPRGWAREAPVKTASRIDVPTPGATVPPGRVAVAGVAWAQGRGIDAVEVRVDDGPWEPARLAAAVSADTWRQWVYEWDAAPGRHRLAVRAVDGEGATQTGTPAPPAPDGAQGWHTISVEVA